MKSGTDSQSLLVRFEVTGPVERAEKE